MGKHSDGLKRIVWRLKQKFNFHSFQSICFRFHFLRSNERTSHIMDSGAYHIILRWCMYATCVSVCVTVYCPSPYNLMRTSKKKAEEKSHESARMNNGDHFPLPLYLFSFFFLPSSWFVCLVCVMNGFGGEFAVVIGNIHYTHTYMKYDGLKTLSI